MSRIPRAIYPLNSEGDQEVQILHVCTCTKKVRQNIYYQRDLSVKYINQLCGYESHYNPLDLNES